MSSPSWRGRPDLVVLYNAGPNVTAAKQLERAGIQTV